MSSLQQRPELAVDEKQSKAAVKPARTAALGLVAVLIGACNPGGPSPTEPRIELRDEATLSAASGQVLLPMDTVAGEVVSIDFGQRSVRLDSGYEVFVSGATRWDRSGNLHSFAELNAAFERERRIWLKATGPVNSIGAVKGRQIKAFRN